MGMTLSDIGSFLARSVRGRAVDSSACDDLVRYGAHSVDDYYSITYPYVFSISWHSYNNEFWSLFNDTHLGAEFLTEWCTDNCSKRFRWDHLRVSLRNTHHGAHLSSDYVFDEMGGGDVLFFAFEDSQDFCLFSLRWGYVAS